MGFGGAVSPFLRSRCRWPRICRSSVSTSAEHFAAFARSFGAVGEIVEDTAQFAPAMERALASGKPAVIEVRIDPQAITPNTTLDKIRAAATAASRK